ncbi:hypothetical protein B0T13DRAFT_93989 [Neurospora crassa]|nr:hypothetical protein B0T13DRAFT_93989 [Neurospora crassa]
MLRRSLRRSNKLGVVMTRWWWSDGLWWSWCVSTVLGLQGLHLVLVLFFFVFVETHVYSISVSCLLRCGEEEKELVTEFALGCLSPLLLLLYYVLRVLPCSCDYACSTTVLSSRCWVWIRFAS